MPSSELGYFGCPCDSLVEFTRTKQTGLLTTTRYLFLFIHQWPVTTFRAGITANELILGHPPTRRDSDNIDMGNHCVDMHNHCMAEKETSKSMIHDSAIYYAHQSKVYRIPPCKTYPVVLAILYILALASVAWVFITHNESAHFQPDVLVNLAEGWQNSTGPIVYPVSRFDLETWTCELSDFGVQFFTSPCRLEQAQRYLLVPLVVISFITVCTGIWAHANDRRIIAEEKAQWQERRNHKSVDGWTLVSLQEPQPAKLPLKLQILRAWTSFREPNPRRKRAWEHYAS